MVKKASQTEASGLMALPCACANLRRTTRVVTQLYSQEIRRSGLEPTQFTLLMALANTGEITQGRLADRHAIDSTTLTRTLDRLRHQGWVVSKLGADRRERLWRLTPAGRKQLQRARPHWERAQKKLRKQLGEKDWNLLQTTLLRAAQAAREI